MNPSFQQKNQQALPLFDSDTAVVEADKTTKRNPAPPVTTTTTTTATTTTTPNNNTIQFTEAQLVRRIEVVAKFIGMTLHSESSGNKNFSKQDPTCKMALDFCTAILQQSGRRLSFSSNNNNNKNEPTANATNNTTHAATTMVAETLPPQIETVLQQLSMTELAGACFIMNYVYSRITSRENYKRFFLAEGYDPAQSTAAAGRLLGCVLMDPALLQKIMSGSGSSYGSSFKLDKTTETANKNKNGEVETTAGITNDPVLRDQKEAASGNSCQPPNHGVNTTLQEEEDDDDRKMPAKTTATATTPITPPNPFTSMAQMQSRILSIRHACYCSADDKGKGNSNEDKTTTSCSLMAPAKCQYFKKLYKHVLECSCENECLVPQCFETKLLLLHYRDCESVLCPLCVPIKLYVTKNTKTKGSKNQQQQQLPKTAAAAAATYPTTAAKVSPAEPSVARKKSPVLFGSYNSSNNENGNQKKLWLHLAETTEFQENSNRNPSSQMMMVDREENAAAATITTRSATRASRRRSTNIASPSFSSKKPRVETPSLAAPPFKA